MAWNRGWPFEQVLERGPGAEPLLVVQHRVAMEERAALAVLAGQANRVAVLQERRVGEVLGESPVHRSFAAGHLPAGVDDTLDAAMQLQVVGVLAELPAEAFDAFDGYCGVAGCPPARPDVRCPVREVRARLIVDQRPRYHAVGFQRRKVGFGHRLRLAGLDDAFGDQTVGVDLARSRLVTDFLVHHRLGREGLVGLVVAVAAEADHVDDHVLLEPHPEVQCEPGDEDHRLGIVAVDVEDRRLHELRDIGAVEGRARIEGVAGGESDLVVHHHVHGAAGAVAACFREVQGLGDHSLTGEGGIAVDQDRQHLVAGGISAALLACADRSFDHGVDDLEMGGIEREHEMERSARRLHRGGEAEVVLDVAGADCGVDLAFELSEQRPGMLAEDVHQHVEPPAMGHADHRLAHPAAPGVLNDFVEERNEVLAAFERESFLTDILAMQVVLELAGRGDPAQDVALLVRVEARPPPASLESFLDPPLLLGGGEVGHLGADGSAVGVAQQLVDLAQGRLRLADVEGADVEHRGPGRLRRSRSAPVPEVGNRRPLVDLDGVDVRATVAAVPVGVDERHDPHLLLRELRHLPSGELPDHCPAPPRAREAPSSPRPAKKSRHCGSTELGSVRQAR